MHPRMNNAPAQSVTNKYTYKHYIFAPTAGTRCLIIHKLFTVIEDVEIIKKFSYF